MTGALHPSCPLCGLTRAFEAIIRSARAPQPRPQGRAAAADSRDTAAERADQAA
jgi:hypothetical protein